MEGFRHFFAERSFVSLNYIFGSVRIDRFDFLFSRSFGDIYNKAIEEIWYKRAVEQYYVNRLSFVYSVPFDVGFSNETLVTASRAIFHHDKQGNKAPAAVVGYQFRHSALVTLFFNTVCPAQDSKVGASFRSDFRFLFR